MQPEILAAILGSKPGSGGGVAPVAPPTSYHEIVLLDSPSFLYPLYDASGAAPVNLAPGGPALGNPGGAASPDFNVDAGLGLLNETDKCIYFNGSDVKYLNSDDDLTLNSGDFTIEAWMKAIGSSGQRTILRSNWTVAGTWYLRFSSDQHAMGAAGASVEGTTALNMAGATWYHLAFVRSGSNGLIYVNGVLESTTVGGMVNSAGVRSGMHVGLAPGAGDKYAGYLAWIAGYPSALSAARILAHFQGRV